MNKVYLKYKNKGEIDINAFRLLGASSKEDDDTKIGFWGSGLKYAMAVLLRNEIDIKVFSGKKEIKITTRKTKMRDDSYDVICINGTPTSITTRMGKDWELWFAIREIVANALDEEGSETGITNEPKGEPGTTHVFVEFNDSLKELYKDWDKFFSNNRKHTHKLGNNLLYPRVLKDRGIIYRRGFKVSTVHNTLFDYDLYNVNINESRVVTSQMDIERELATLWKNFATEDMLVSFCSESCYEKDDMDWNWYSSGMFSSTWLKFLQNKQIIPKEAAGFFIDLLSNPHIQLPTQMCQLLHKQFGSVLNIAGMTDRGDLIKHKIIEPTNYHKDVLWRVVKKIKPYIEDIDAYPMLIAIMDHNKMGEAINGSIVISESTFTRGEREVMNTVIEEYSHLKSTAGDRTREFQDFIINLVSQTIERQKS